MQKDTTFTKIFVGGLPYHTTDKSLGDFFEQFGDIEEAVVITDRQTGKSRGYGFVTMADAKAAERACRDPNPIIDGRKANVNLAYLGAKPRDIPNILSSLSCIRPSTGFPGLIQAGAYGIPQYIYPASYLASAPGLLAASPHAALAASTPTHSVQQTQLPHQGAATQLDYSGAAAAYAQAQYAATAATAGFDPSAYSPYAAATSPATAAYFAAAPGYAGYAALPTTAASQTALAAFPAAAYQQQQSQLQAAAAAAAADRV